MKCGSFRVSERVFRLNDLRFGLVLQPEQPALWLGSFLNTFLGLGVRERRDPNLEGPASLFLGYKLYLEE